MSDQQEKCPVIVVGPGDLEIEQVVAIARGRATATLDPDPEFRGRIKAASKLVGEAQQAGHEIYGVTTGVGDSVGNRIPPTLRDEMPLNLLRFHGVGTGRILSEEEAAAVVVARLASLSRGASGVREIVLERLVAALNQRLLPRIPAEGSVGASGDLTPLSYLAAMLVGEREVSLAGRVVEAREALDALDLTPLWLRPKESLAIMNGTSMMTGLACLAHERAHALAALAAVITALNSHAIAGNPGHFDDRIFALKPHPGTRACGAAIRQSLEGSSNDKIARLQDRYSIRCAPHVIGVLLDALRAARVDLTIELNGVSDNPLLDPRSGEILHGGNFYGGHVCHAMDAIKAATAGVADLLDRQIALLCVPSTSSGLSENLVADQGAEGVVHHGFKAMQITASALAAEACKLSMPASAFSRSTESHNQDKVSMGSIAARDCLRALELAEHVAAIALLAGCQALDLRGPRSAGRGIRALHDAVRERIPMVREDRRQDVDIQSVVEIHRIGGLPGVARGEALRAMTEQFAHT